MLTPTSTKLSGIHTDLSCYTGVSMVHVVALVFGFVIGLALLDSEYITESVFVSNIQL